MQSGSSRVFFYLLLLSAALWITPSSAAAQTAQTAQTPGPPQTPTGPQKKTREPVFELGGVVSGITGKGLGNDFGVGGRFSYTYAIDPGSEVGGVSALEAEIKWLPVNKASDVFHGGRALEALFGVTEALGDTGERLGVKLRSGFVRSSRAVTQLSPAPNGAFLPVRLGAITNPVLDFGLLYERFRPKSHWGMRFDAGDLVVFYPDLPLRGFRVRHHLEASVGLSYRFPLGRKSRVRASETSWKRASSSAR